ncbi:unnamed protein product [Phaedon cochleariae]|uniref:Uncharacterized protein n=1 Tax=Phaedon cochleariae TaxID=80249 RepID=A0A9P0DEQ4_PHACE|nr:unnamed protein product [Phaedon cochleariae]
MESFEYYKSLVTDEEVIKALTLESQAREGTLEKPRVRPNLNFLQRTVSNMVSSNNRLTTKQKEMINKEKEKNSSYRPRRIPVRKKLHIEIIKDILSEKIDFVKSSDEQKIGPKYVSQQPREMSGSLNRQSQIQLTSRSRNKKPMSKHRSQLEVVREILIGRIESLKAKKTACNSNSSDPPKTSSTKKYLMSKTETLCYSLNSNVITLDDSDSSSSGSKSTNLKSSDSGNESSKIKRKKYKRSEDSKTHFCIDDGSKQGSSSNSKKRKKENGMTEVIQISDSDGSE